MHNDFITLGSGTYVGSVIELKVSPYWCLTYIRIVAYEFLLPP